VSVKVAAVNLDDRQIDLVMIGDNVKGRAKSGASASRKPLTARERTNLEGAKTGGKGTKSSTKSDAKPRRKKKPAAEAGSKSSPKKPVTKKPATGKSAPKKTVKKKPKR
jgi:ribonuclease R